MEFKLLIGVILIYVSCKFERLNFDMAQVIEH